MKHEYLFKINGKEYKTSCTATIYAPKKKIQAQRDLGYKVISGTTKSLYYIANSQTVNCIVLYSSKPEITSDFLNDILSTACYNGCDVYIKVNDDFYTYMPTVPQKTARDRYLDRKAYKDTRSQLSLENDIMNHKARVTNKGKIKLTKFIRYYDLDLPVTEAEWYNTYIQIKFYAKHKIKFSFDKNLFTTCPECHELIRRGAEEEHVCYCDLAPKKTHMDYIVNGDADNQEVEEWI